MKLTSKVDIFRKHWNRSKLLQNLQVLWQYLQVLHLQVNTFFKYWLNTCKYFLNTYKYCHNTCEYLAGEYTPTLCGSWASNSEVFCHMYVHTRNLIFFDKCTYLKSSNLIISGSPEGKFLSGRKFTSATTLAVCFSENQNWLLGIISY